MGTEDQPLTAPEARRDRTGPGAEPRTRLHHSPSLVDRYQAYRRAQGRELLSVIPREGIRTLLRHFKVGESNVDEASVLDWLATRCGELLPLPPFDVWARDFHRHRDAYAHLPGPPLAPTAPSGEPVTVEVRTVDLEGDEWVAALAIRTQDEGWVGHVRFHSAGVARSYTTGDIFREPSPLRVRERFRSFDDATLTAFLRSALP